VGVRGGRGAWRGALTKRGGAVELKGEEGYKTKK